MDDKHGLDRTRRDLLRGVGAALGAAAASKAATTAGGAQSAAGSAPELCFRTATELVGLIRSGQASVREVLRQHLDQIERVNPRVNAICTLVADQAMAQAGKADEALARGERGGPLFGLPVAIKDLVSTRGIRTTFGSLVYKDFVPAEDDLFVERLKSAGAIVIGKTNTPEFGAGSQTFNKVFGITRNPYDLSRTSGGSSGGGAAALACGMIPIADGSDLGGSVRNPPNFCNVAGLRPSPGRVPRYPSRNPWNTLPVLGPMARTVQDAALLLSVMAGPDPRDPISLPEPGSVFLAPLERSFRGTRLAYSPDLGQFPVQKAVTDVIEKALPVFRDLGCDVEQSHPDFRDAAEIFQVLRASDYAFSRGAELEKHRDLLKDTVVWNIEQGLKLSALDVSRAQALRAALYQRVREFLERCRFLLLPVSQVAPFPVEVEWVREINGVRMETYIDWMKSCS
ncbi:MAG: hypothetical protein FJW35_13950, partial [Acidobacteria bacterium]|nr:hypothetical protein [Acidobacteriota bacterium]